MNDFLCLCITVKVPEASLSYVQAWLRQTSLWTSRWVRVSLTYFCRQRLIVQTSLRQLVFTRWEITPTKCKLTLVCHRRFAGNAPVLLFINDSVFSFFECLFLTYLFHERTWRCRLRRKFALKWVRLTLTSTSSMMPSSNTKQSPIWPSTVGCCWPLFLKIFLIPPGELYYENKEFETRPRDARPGLLSFSHLRFFLGFFYYLFISFLLSSSFLK